jgi:glycosyltransferase involved in cell wall biosynthesis
VTLRVIQVNSMIDAEGRSPKALLDAWPTLPLVATAAVRAGADVTVLLASTLTETYWQEGVTYQFFREPRLRGGRGAGLLPWRLMTAAKALRPDVIHFNGLDFPFHLRALRGVGKPVLVQDHASRPHSKRNALRRWGLRGIAAAAFTSAEQAVPFKQAGVLASDLPILEIAESSSTFGPGDRGEARRATGVHGDPAVLWVANLIPRKDPLTMLRAVRRALDRLPGLQVWCVFASADLLPDLQRLLGEDAQLAAHVHLLGPVPHGRVEILCRACDVFLLPSHFEGSGYALIEALACGLTPVVSNIPSFRSLTGNGKVGALVPVGDADALAAGLVEQARKPRDQARAQVLAHFEQALSPDALGRSLLRAYETLAAGTSGQ